MYDRQLTKLVVATLSCRVINREVFCMISWFGQPFCLRPVLCANLDAALIKVLFLCIIYLEINF